MNYFDHATAKDRPCLIVAHRGVWRDAPENSLLSIRRAIEAGYDAVEIDVRATADGAFVLMHDDTLERMTGQGGSPERLTFGDLTSMPLRNRNGGPVNRMTNERLAGLREVFEMTRDRILIHLDIKQRHLIPDVLAEARKAGVDQQVDVWADLRTEADLAWIRENILCRRVPFVARTHLEHPDADAQVELVFRLQPLICEISFTDITQVDGLRQRFRDAGITLWVNTLDDVASSGFTDTAAVLDPGAIWGRLLDAGFSAVQTDEMACLRAYIAARRTEPTAQARPKDSLAGETARP